MNNKLVKASVILIILTGVSKVAGFLREIVLAYFYGASAMTDAYITSTTVVTILIGGITSATALAYIPRATAARVEGKDVSNITSNLMTTTGILILIISVIGLFFSRQLTWLFAMGLEESTLLVAARMTSIILPFCFIYAVNNIAMGYLQSVNSFWYIAGSNIIANFVLISFIAMSNQSGNVLAAGYVMSWIAPAVGTAVLTRKKGLHFRPVINLEDQTLRDIIVSSVPIFLGQLVLQFNTLVDRNFASMLGEGIISAMQYANKLNLLFITLFVIPLATIIFPRLSEQAAREDIAQLKSTATKSFNVILLFVMPIVAGIIILAQPLVELVFMRGQFSQEAAIITANVLAVYSLGIPGLSFAEILNREFYALKDTKTPVICSVVSISTNIILNIILVKPLGYIGLALATSIASTVLAAFLFILLRRKIGAIGMRHLLVNIIKTLVAALIMDVIVYFLNGWLVTTLGSGTMGRRLATILLDILVGAGVYFVLVFIFKVREVLELIKLVRRKVRKATLVESASQK